MHAVVSLITRGIMLLSSAVVLGLSVTLAKQQVYGSVPSETGFGSFVGAFGIIVAAVGMLAAFFDRIPGVVTLGLDTLITICFLAGGIALAVAMKGVSCTSDDIYAVAARANDKILNGGCQDDFCAYGGSTGGRHEFDDSDNSSLKARCVRAQADFAFEFIAFAFALGSLVVTLLARKSSGKAVFV